jgi:hypothetical protein
MNDKGFREYLKRDGRKPDVIDRVFRLVNRFEQYLLEVKDGINLDQATLQDLHDYVLVVESVPKASAKTHLWAIRYYYAYIENEEMAVYTAALREERITRKPFRLRDFRGVDPAYVDALKYAGIKNVSQMLVAGRTPEQREELAERTGVPLENILELVKLSDLSRIPGVKGIRARLYHDAGVDTIENMAHWEPEKLRTRTIEYIRQSGFDGMPPLPAEVKFSVEKARRLPRVVEYD